VEIKESEIVKMVRQKTGTYIKLHVSLVMTSPRKKNRNRVTDAIRKGYLYKHCKKKSYNYSNSSPLNRNIEIQCVPSRPFPVPKMEKNVDVVAAMVGWSLKQLWGEKNTRTYSKV